MFLNLSEAQKVILGHLQKVARDGQLGIVSKLLPPPIKCQAKSLAKQNENYLPAEGR